MGLAGARKRHKFSYDPNNTAWTNSESKYGQRILQAQGWKPGDFLGAQNAPHAKHYTEANASHIRVALRDENAGLGSRRGAAGGEWQTTGLNGFQDLLGRLNGKTEQEIEKTQRLRAETQRRFYADQRWGGSRFISGGFLVGDRIKEEGLKDASAEQFNADESKPPDWTRNSLATSSTGQVIKSEETEEEVRLTEIAAKSPELSKTERRAAKAERQLQRKLKREAREAKATAKLGNLSEEPAALPKPNEGETPDIVSGQDTSIEQKTAPVQLNSTSTPLRHISRQRNIKHKKMAMMDARALNEILMIKG